MDRWRERDSTEETEGRGKLRELEITHKALATGSLAGLSAMPTVGAGYLRHYTSLPPTLAALSPAHLHLRYSYTLTHSAHAFTDHSSFSPSPHSHECSLTMNFTYMCTKGERYLHSPSLSYTLLHTPQQTSLMSLRG